MTPYSESVREIHWQEVFPWLIVVRAARVAVMVRVWALTIIGVGITQLGWQAIDYSVPTGSFYAEQIWVTPGELPLGAPPLSAPGVLDRVVRGAWDNPLFRSVYWPIQPWLRILRDGLGKHVPGLMLAGTWALAVWALFGGAIARITAIRLTRNDSITLPDALRTARRSWGAAMGAPLLAISGLTLMSVPLWFASWLLQYEFPALVVAAAWGGLLVAGFAVFAIAVGWLIGWPLMAIAAAVERTDAFDGVSRGYAYVYQRPLHLLWYVVVAAAISFLVDFAVRFGAGGAVATSELFAADILSELRTDAVFSLEGASPPWTITAIRGWLVALGYAVECLPMALVWTLTTSIYLLLRQQIDDTELDECAADDADASGGWN